MKHVSAEILDVLHMSGLDIFLAFLLSGKAAVWYDQKAWTGTAINPPDDYFYRFYRRGST